MSDKPLTERVHDAPTMRQRVTSVVRKVTLDYVAPAAAALGFLTAGGGACFGIIYSMMQEDDIIWCRGAIEAGADPANFRGRYNKEPCAELLRRDEESKKLYGVVPRP